jgi:ribosomal protein S18 acetylase RimI-like enzyme
MRSPPLVVIRGRRASDDAFIAELGKEAFTEYSSSASGYTAHMAANAHTLIAEHDDVAVGLAIVDLRAGRAHLAAIAVRTEWRGVGVGRTLLTAAERYAKSRGAVEMELTTADSNLAASELFLRNGYRRRARHPRYYARGQHAIEMFKPLFE